MTSGRISSVYPLAAQTPAPACSSSAGTIAPDARAEDAAAGRYKGFAAE